MVVTVIVRPQNICCDTARVDERWYSLHHIAKPIVKCDIVVCGNRGQSGQIFVVACRAKKRRRSREQREPDIRRLIAKSYRAFHIRLSSRHKPPITWLIHRFDRAETNSSLTTDNNYSSNVLCGLCQREHAPLGQTRHTWGRRKNSQRVKAVRKTVARSIQEPRIRQPLTRSTLCVAGKLDLRLTFK